MGLAEAIAGEWRHIDGVETVAYTSPADVTDADVKAIRQAPSWREVTLGGPAGIQATDVVWLVWAETCSQTPVQRGKITDSAGAVWTILSFAAETWGAITIRWRCVCRKQV